MRPQFAGGSRAAGGHTKMANEEEQVSDLGKVSNVMPSATGTTIALACNFHSGSVATSTRCPIIGRLSSDENAWTIRRRMDSRAPTSDLVAMSSAFRTYRDRLRLSFEHVFHD